MKTQRKLMAVGIVIALVAVFSVINASAIVVSNGTINNVSSQTTGDYTVNATFGPNTFTFTIDSSAANANAILSIALTAAATGDLVQVDYSAGGALNRLWLFTD